MRIQVSRMTVIVAMLSSSMGRKRARQRPIKAEIEMI
jgi:hypothetical protein